MNNINSPPVVIRIFLIFAGLIFLITGTAKIWIAFSKLKILSYPDPVFAIKFNTLLLVIGIVEIILGGFCLYRKCEVVRIVAVSYFSTALLVYRMGVWGVGWKKPCSCLGNFSDALHVTPGTADSAMKTILTLLLIGSYASLFWLWRQWRTAPASN